MLKTSPKRRLGARFTASYIKKARNRIGLELEKSNIICVCSLDVWDVNVCSLQPLATGRCQRVVWDFPGILVHPYLPFRFDGELEMFGRVQGSLYIQCIYTCLFESPVEP